MLRKFTEHIVEKPRSAIIWLVCLIIAALSLLSVSVYRQTHQKKTSSQLTSTAKKNEGQPDPSRSLNTGSNLKQDEIKPFVIIPPKGQ